MIFLLKITMNSRQRQQTDVNKQGQGQTTTQCKRGREKRHHRLCQSKTLHQMWLKTLHSERRMVFRVSSIVNSQPDLLDSINISVGAERVRCVDGNQL